MTSKLSVFFSELKRRKVYHVAAAYLAVGVGMVYGIPDLFSTFGLSDSAARFVIVLIAIGFPVALVLAWVYEVRPEEPTVDKAASAQPSRQEANPAKHSIVVLPFDNLSPDPDDAYFSDGLTEEIIADLSGLRSLRVISRTSAVILKESGKDVRTIGEELAVSYVLEGSVRKAGERLRVTAQLIDTVTDAHIWSERYDGELGNVFSIQENVARSIADALKVEMTPEETRGLASRSVPDLAAYECVLRARHEIWTGTEESIHRAIAYLQTAQEVVGENVAILSALAEAHFMLPHVTGVGMQGLADQLDSVAERILRIDPGAATGHFNKGLAAAKRPWGFREAIRELRKATELDPTDTIALIFRAFWAAQLGCVDEALNVSSQMTALDPISPVSFLNRGYCLMFAGALDEAVALAERSVRMDPTSTYWRWALIINLAQSGRRDEVAELAKGLRDGPMDNWALSSALLGAALLGEPTQTFLTPQLLATAKHDETFSWMLAQSFAQVGQTDDALSWLGNAISLGFINPDFLSRQDVLLEPLRDDPRFVKLVATARHESEALRLDPPSA